MTLQALSLVEKAEQVQVHFTLRLRDQQSRWIQDGCKVYMDSYMASYGSCFMATWIIFKNHLLEVNLTQTKRSWHSECSQPLIYFILSCMKTCMNRHSLKWHLIEGLVTHGFTLHFRFCDHTRWFWKWLGTAFGHFFGLSQFHGHGSWLVCEVALKSGGWVACKATESEQVTI